MEAEGKESRTASVGLVRVGRVDEDADPARHGKLVQLEAVLQTRG